MTGVGRNIYRFRYGARSAQVRANDIHQARVRALGQLRHRCKKSGDPPPRPIDIELVSIEEQA